MTEQLCSMEYNEFPIPYLSDKTPEAVFHGQTVKYVAYLRVSTAQQDVRRQRLRRPRVRTQTRLPHRRFHRDDHLNDSSMLPRRRKRPQAVTPKAQRPNRFTIPRSAT